MKNFFNITMVFTGLLLASSTCQAAVGDAVISLAGQWRFQLDRHDVGLSENWADKKLTGTVKLPGGLTEQGIGDPPSLATKWMGSLQNPNWFNQPEYAAYTNANKFKFPYWLTPNLYYQGAAWYQRDFEVPADWKHQRIVLFLERAHWETTVWVDGHPLGTNTALGTPHEHVLGQLAPGKHTLTIRVDNRLIVNIGDDAHSVTDHTQGDWNGLIGRLELQATPLVWLDDVQVYPDVAHRAARVKIHLGNVSGEIRQVQVHLAGTYPGQKSAATASLAVAVPTGGTNVEADVALGEAAPLWDEFHPVLCTLTTRLTQANLPNAPSDTRRVLFGLRQLATDGTQFTLNGHKIFFRGTLDCAIFPKTGHPPMDVATWKHELETCRAYGLNHIRFHSWCPPEAAFEAADELGFYFQVESSAWANGSSSVGDGKPQDRWIYQETTRILKYYGNHPSLMLMPYGNEPGGKNQRKYLAGWVKHFRALDPRHLYTSASGWPELPENQYDVTPKPRIQQWGEGLRSRINARPPETTTDYHDFISKRPVPVISHEIGQWCVYPNFREMPKYTGYLKPRNFEIFRDRLREHGMGGLDQAFVFASGKLQALCYKEDIESALRTHGMGGFQLLGLQDFPGQGTALVGVVDPLWDPKSYINAREFRRFCNDVVPLARMSKRVFTTDETFSARLELSNFGPEPITNAVLDWKLVDKLGQPWASGQFGPQLVPVDNGNIFGEIHAGLAKVSAPAEGKLVVRLRGTQFENDWDIWVYPPAAPVPAPPEIAVVNDLTDAAVARLKAGGKVLLLIPPERVKGDPKLGKVGLGFSSIFWNTAWTRGQLPTTLGILCNPKNPLFSRFPTKGYSNWQWWYLIHNAAAMVLTDLPKSLNPDVRVIDDWFTARPLGLVFEAKAGGGKLMVCSIDLEHGMATDPVRTQFRRSLLDYMAGPKFAPQTSLSLAQIRSLITAPSAMEKLGAHIESASSYDTGHEPEKLLDGDPKTFWHTHFHGNNPPGFPHQFEISLTKSEEVDGFTLLPRQDGNENGMIKSCEFYVSRNGRDWGEPVWRGQLSAGPDLKKVQFTKAVSGRYVRFVALSGQSAGPWASIAEFELQIKS